MMFLDILPGDIARRVRLYRERRWERPRELDLAVTQWVAEEVTSLICAACDGTPPTEAALRWLALAELARRHRRGSRPCREAERGVRYALGEAAEAILARWPADGPPVPEALRATASRHRLFLTGADAGTTCATPEGAAQVAAQREAGSAVWQLYLRPPEGEWIGALGYFAQGALSARRLRIEAVPLFDALGQFWGVEARVSHLDSRTGEATAAWGAEWRRTPQGWVGSEVGRLTTEAMPCWPSVGPYWRRQGDCLFIRRAGIAGGHVWEGGPGGWTDSHVPDRGTWHRTHGADLLKVPEEGTVVRHVREDHPTIRLSGGWWQAVRASGPVRPRVAD